jgi:hypothetical protein
VDSENVIKARQHTEEVMDLVEKEKVGDGKEKEKVADEQFESLVDEDESLLSDVDSVDASENDKSTGADHLEEQMEDLQDEDHQVKFTVDDDVMEDDVVVLAGANKKMDSVRSSAYSKYASTEVAVKMNVDSPEEMLQLTKLKDLAQRKRLEFNANLRDAQGTGVKTGTKLGNSGGASSSSGAGAGAKGSKTGGAGGASTGVKNSKTDGKLPLKTKQDARRAQ